MKDEGQKRIGQVAAAVVAALICVRFSAAYFTYAMICFALAFLYFWHKNGRVAFRMDMNHAMRLFLCAPVAFYGALLLSAMVRLDMDGAKVAFSYAAYFLAFFMTYLLCRFSGSGRGTEIGFLISGLVIVGYAFWVPPDIDSSRAISFFAHPNHLGTYCALLIPFSLCMIWQKRQAAERAVATFLAVMLFICLWKTESRGAVLGLAGGLTLAAMMVLWGKRKYISHKIWMTSVMALFVTIAIGLGAVFSFTTNRGNQATICNSGGERLLMWQASIEMWEDNKWTGVGLDNWGRAYYSEAYHPAQGTEEGHDMPHNMVLQFLSTAGLIGTAGYIAFIVLLTMALWATLQTSTHPLFTMAAFSALFSTVIQGMVDTTLVNAIPARIFFALTGYYFATYQEKWEE